MSSRGPQAACDSVLATLDGHEVNLADLPAGDLADGAVWMLEQALSLARSCARPRELLDATVGTLITHGPVASPAAGPGWALWVITSELTVRSAAADEALIEGLTRRPKTSWVALAQVVATMAFLHDGDGARAWLRARRP